MRLLIGMDVSLTVLEILTFKAMARFPTAALFDALAW